MKWQVWQTRLWIGITFVLIGGNAGCFSSTVSLNSQHQNYIGKRVAIVPTRLPASNFSGMALITQDVEARLSGFSSFQQIVTATQVEERLAQSPQLRQQIETYAETLALVGISDKDLSSRIGQSLGVEQFLVLQVDEYPCTQECRSDRQLVMRFQLVDAASGDLIWKGRKHEKLTTEVKDEASLQRVAKELSQDLVETVMEEFVVPWHRLRYQSLQKLRTTPAPATSPKAG